jgi:hypothetical protein
MSLAERGAAHGVELKEPAGSGWMNPDWLRQDKIRAQAGSLADTREGEWLTPSQVMDQTLDLSRWYLGHTPEGPVVFGVVPQALRSRQSGREGKIPLASTQAFDRAKERGFRRAMERFYVLGYLSLEQAKAQLGGKDPFEAVDEWSDLPRLRDRKLMEKKLPLKTSGSDSVLSAVGTVAAMTLVAESAKRLPKKDEQGRHYRLVRGLYTASAAVTAGGLALSACMPAPQIETKAPSNSNTLRFLELTQDQKSRLLEGVKDGKLRLASVENGSRVDLPVTDVAVFSDLMPVEDEIYSGFQLTQYELGDRSDRAIEQWTFVKKDGQAEAVWVVWVTEQSQLDQGREIDLTAWQLHLDVNGLASVEKGVDGQPIAVGKMVIPADRARLAQLEIHPPEGKSFWKLQTDRFMNSIGQILALTAGDALAQESTATPEPSPTSTEESTATPEPTATPDPLPAVLVTEAEAGDLWPEVQATSQNLVEHEVKGVTVGVEQVQDRQGNLVELVVVRERETQNIVVHVDGWADKPDRWVAAEAVEGTTQTPFIVDPEWAEIPKTLRLQPQANPNQWYVAYSDGSYFFTWRRQAERVMSDWSMKGLYAATRLKMPDKFERIIWVEPPEVDTSDAAVDAWVENMITQKKFFAGVEEPDYDYIRRALSNIKTMPLELRAFVLAYNKSIVLRDQDRSLSTINGIVLSNIYLNPQFDPNILKYFANAVAHEAVHQWQQKEYPDCIPHDNLEHQAWYLANYKWLTSRGIFDSKYVPMFEAGTYPTCSG